MWAVLPLPSLTKLEGPQTPLSECEYINDKEKYKDTYVNTVIQIWFAREWSFLGIFFDSVYFWPQTHTQYCVNPGKMSNLNAAANVTRQNKTILYNLVWRGRQLSIECLCMRWRLAIFSRQKKPNWEYIVRWLRKPSSNEKWSNSAREIESWDQNSKRLNSNSLIGQKIEEKLRPK